MYVTLSEPSADDDTIRSKLFIRKNFYKSFYE